MAKRREELVLFFTDLLGTRNVYYQPPESVKMNYPAIVLGLDAMPSQHADNGVYVTQKRYWAVLIDKDPDSLFVDKLVDIPTCKFERQYKSENLNHWRFSFYY